MEQNLIDNMYLIDLSQTNTPAEIIFELSSYLDREEAKNKRISLKLGNVELNQAQLLSIKSLICGIDSTLSAIDTQSVETEKVALSLGLIVANVSNKNITVVEPEMTYKTIDEVKQENQNQNLPQEENMQNSEENVSVNEENHDNNTTQEQPSWMPNETNEEIVYQTAEDAGINDVKVENNSENQQLTTEYQNVDNLSGDNISSQETTVIQNEEVHDELNAIFGTDKKIESIFDTFTPEKVYSDGNIEYEVLEQEYTKEDIEIEQFPTKYIKQTIRSGQVINYEGNIVIIGDCHPGCEITALGDITVWGILGGIAHAGAAGNEKARIRALKMNAIQLRIANYYSRRPDTLNTIFVEKTNSFIPEEARIINGEIVVFKIND